jgi:hypothetical protein
MRGALDVSQWFSRTPDPAFEVAVVNPNQRRVIIAFPTLIFAQRQ